MTLEVIIVKYMREKLNRYSIRKLTVGAASVLIGISFISSAQTAHADTIKGAPADQEQQKSNLKQEKPNADLTVQANKQTTVKATKATVKVAPVKTDKVAQPVKQSANNFAVNQTNNNNIESNNEVNDQINNQQVAQNNVQEPVKATRTNNLAT